MKRATRISLAFSACIGAGCGSAPPPEADGAVPAPVSQKPSASKIPKKSATKPRVFSPVELSEEDFVESPRNRDPFRTYMDEFKEAKVDKPKVQVNAILAQYGLDEIKLTAIVSGGVRTRAMFRDPTGFGVTVRRDDYISKSNGRIKQILADSVIVEILERAEGRQVMADRVIKLHPDEKRK
jgi:Tfp pilus assembly protein PilP